MSDTKRIALLIFLVLWAIFSLAVSVRAEEFTSPKCGDELAFNVPVHKKLGTAHRVTGDYGGFGGAESATGAGCSTTTISQDTGTDTGLDFSVTHGQGFTMDGTTLTSVKVYFHSTSGSPTVEMRINNSSDFTTYLATQTSSALSDGAYTFTFNLSGLTDAGQYYFGMMKKSGTAVSVYYIGSSAYAGANNTFIYGGGPADWDMNSPNPDADLRFVISGCE